MWGKMDIKKILEGIQDIIKFNIIRTRIKLLNPSPEDMTNIEKNAYLVNLVDDLKKNPENVDKIIEVIKTIEDVYRINLIYSIDDYLNQRRILDEDSCAEVFKKLYLSCAPTQVKINNLTCVNLHPYVSFAEEILEDVIDDIGKEEIEFILTAELNHFRSEKEMKLLISKGFNLDYVYEGLETGDYKLNNYLEMLPSEKVISFIEKRLNARKEDKDDTKYTREIDAIYNENISEIDKIYLRIVALRGKVELFDKLNKEELKLFLSKYGKKIIDLEKRYETKTLQYLLYNCFKYKRDYTEIIEEIKSWQLEGQEEVINRVIEEAYKLADESKKISEINSKLEKYKEASENEKREFILNNSTSEELSDIFIYADIFGETLKNLSKEEMVSLAKRNSDAFKWLLINPNISLEDIYELIHNKEIILNNNQLLTRRKFVGKLYNKDKESKEIYFEFPLEEVVDLYNFDEELA